ncbi:MAG: hypothetical protein AB7T06_41750 [Kofleriaceae bacterium]
MSARGTRRPFASAAAACAIAVASSGCFTSWAITQGFGAQRILDEGVREQTVPLAGVEEKLAVSLPLDIQYEYGPAAPGTSTRTTQTRERTELPFALTCSTKQYAQDRVYHSAFRYGSRWKKTAGVSFLLEAALGAALLMIDRNRGEPEPGMADDRSGLVAGGFLAIDAVGTLAIFFIPRKEVFTVDDKAVMTPIREDCPEGLVLEIAGTSYPVDAAGRIGDVGEAALDEWMRAADSAPGAPGAPGTTGTLALTFGGRAMPLRVEARERCAWIRARQSSTAITGASNATPSSATSPGDAYAGTDAERACNSPGRYVTTADLPRVTTAVISVPTGSLSMATTPAAATDSR